MLPFSLSHTHTPTPTPTSLCCFSYTYFCPCPPPPVRQQNPSGWRRGRNETTQRKVSLHITRIERRWERSRAGGFAEMGTVCLFAGGCCCSPFPAFHMFTFGETVCRFQVFLSPLNLSNVPRKMRTQSHNKYISPIISSLKTLWQAAAIST